jgi:hypothetical protein
MTGQRGVAGQMLAHQDSAAQHHLCEPASFKDRLPEMIDQIRRREVTRQNLDLLVEQPFGSFN